MTEGSWVVDCAISQEGRLISMRTLDKEDQVNMLNTMTVGKTISQIAYNEDGIDYLSIYFEDGSKIVLSTLGGIEIEVERELGENGTVFD